MKKSAISIFLLSLSTAAIAGGVHEVPVSADTRIDWTVPTDNFGAAENILITESSIGLIRFHLDPNSTWPEVKSDRIAKASLWVWVNGIEVPEGAPLETPLYFAPTYGEYGEDAVTWNTLPPIGDAFHERVISASRQFVLVDVTEQVKAWVDNPDSHIGFAVRSFAPGVTVSLDSKENPLTGHQPRLMIALTPTPGPQGIQGERGLDGLPGKDGVDGINGVDGVAGVDGIDGKDGKDGIDGVAGVNGTNGVDGLPGKDGAPGADGKDGKDGLPGRDGIDGKDGRDGEMGPQGPVGPMGPSGPKGDKGHTGPQGPKGEKGDKGDPGYCKDKCK